MIPALLTRTSSRPNCSTAASISAWPPSGVDTSLPSATAAPPAATISSTTATAGPTSAPSPSIEPPRSLTTTEAPRSASRRAWARPMPRPAPVTTATRPSNRCSFTRDPRPCTVRSSAGNRDGTPTQREVEGAPRRDRRHLGPGLRPAGLPRHRHRRAVRGQRAGQGRVLPLHRVEGGAARRHPRPGDGRGDARRRAGGRVGRIAGRTAGDARRRAARRHPPLPATTSGSSSTSSRPSPPSGPRRSACGAASTSGGSKRSCRPASTAGSSVTSTPGSRRWPGSACTTTPTCG